MFNQAQVVISMTGDGLCKATLFNEIKELPLSLDKVGGVRAIRNLLDKYLLIETATGLHVFDFQ